ncbi:hypothetical protein ACHAWF_013194 [Thalassiosira exigua]
MPPAIPPVHARDIVSVLLLVLIAAQRLMVGQSKLHSPASTPTFALANNVTVPLVGLGSASGVAHPHVRSAIEAGYRYVDTAQSHSWGYREEDVGRAVKDAKRRYEDWPSDDSPGEYVYVQTKIHPQDLGYRSTQTAIQVSLERQQVDSLDSVLLHKPRCWEGVCTREPEGTWHDNWTALEEAVDSGVVRAIGICDVDNGLLDELLRKRIAPMVIQNWFDPFHQDKTFRRRIERHNEQHPERRILYQGYSSLGTQWFHHKGYDENPVLNHPLLQSVAKEHGATVAQVVIQWAAREGVMVLPASTNPSRQASNLDSFSFALTEEEMRAIDALDGKPPKKERKLPDSDEVQLAFVNRAEGPVDVYWVPKGGGEEDRVHVGEMKGSGDSLRMTSYHGHAFVFKEAGGEDGKTLNQHVVDRALGAKQNHEILDTSEEL